MATKKRNKRVVPRAESFKRVAQGDRKTAKEFLKRSKLARKAGAQAAALVLKVTAEAIKALARNKDAEATRLRGMR